MDKGPLLSTEGLVTGLYRHLWMKNQAGQSADVNLPHTVVFQDSSPCAWYFTSVKEGKVCAGGREAGADPFGIFTI